MAGTLLRESIRRMHGRYARRRLYFAIFLVLATLGVAVGTQHPQVLLIGGVLVALMLLSLIGPLIRRAVPSSHVHVAKLMAHYKITLEQLSSHVESERAVPVATPTQGGVEVLKSYVLRLRRDYVGLIRTGDILWLYPYERIVRQNQVETEHTTGIVCWTAYSDAPLLLAAEPHEIAAVYPVVCAQVPWAMHGYSQQLAAAWADPTQRAGMVDQIRLKRGR